VASEGNKMNERRAVRKLGQNSKEKDARHAESLQNLGERGGDYSFREGAGREKGRGHSS